MQFLLPLAVAVFESQTLFSLPFFHSHFLYLCSSTYLFFFFVFILVYWLLYNLSFFFLLHYHQYLRYSLVKINFFQDIDITKVSFVFLKIFCMHMISNRTPNMFKEFSYLPIMLDLIGYDMDRIGGHYVRNKIKA